MGSFNLTCSFSGLPIEVGDRVRLFLLQKTVPSDFSGTSPFDFWGIRTIPVSGIYNDYAKFILGDPFIQDSWMKGFQKDLIEISKGGFPVFKTFTVEQLLDPLWRGKVSVGKGKLIGMSAVREDIWNFLLEQRKRGISFEEFVDNVRQSMMNMDLSREDSFFAESFMKENNIFRILHDFQNESFSSLICSLKDYFDLKSLKEDRDLLLRRFCELGWSISHYRSFNKVVSPSFYADLCGENTFDILERFHEKCSLIMKGRKEEWERELG